MRSALERSPRIALFEEIETRRLYQIGKGYDREHDDEHDMGEIARGAAAYAIVGNPHNHERSAFSNDDIAKMLWPWDMAAFNPALPRENLIDAVAMLVAEIERLDRSSRR